MFFCFVVWVWGFFLFAFLVFFGVVVSLLSCAVLQLHLLYLNEAFEFSVAPSVLQKRSRNVVNQVRLFPDINTQQC